MLNIHLSGGYDMACAAMNAKKDCQSNSKLIGVVSQKDPTIQNPGLDDIQSTGTVAKILRVLQMPYGNVTVIIQGKKRFSIEKVLSEEPYITAEIIEI